MAETAADILLDTLIWGVDTIFGLPGDGINDIMEALRTRTLFRATKGGGDIARTVGRDLVRELI